MRSFFSLSRCHSSLKSHWSWSSFKATLYQLLAAKRLFSNYINISVFKTSEHCSHYQMITMIENEGGGLAGKRDSERETSLGSRSSPTALQEI